MYSFNVWFCTYFQMSILSKLLQKMSFLFQMTIKVIVKNWMISLYLFIDNLHSTLFDNYLIILLIKHNSCSVLPPFMTRNMNYSYLPWTVLYFALQNVVVTRLKVCTWLYTNASQFPASFKQNIKCDKMREAYCVFI